MGLKETYESWVFRPIAGVGANATPVKQSEGDVSVNFLQDTYQPRKEVNRAPGDTVVTQATEDNATAGMAEVQVVIGIDNGRPATVAM